MWLDRLCSTDAVFSESSRRRIMLSASFLEAIELIKNGKIGVLPTDTIYGLVGSALSPRVVERIYAVRKRSGNKPFIVLISSINDLHLFGIVPDEKLRIFLEKNWPGKVSIIIGGVDEKYKYLHRGEGSIAFRLPDKKELLDLISQTGPLVAPSANHEGETPAKTIAEAKNYFGGAVDFYIDGGTLEDEPSTLVKYDHGEFVILRKGAVKLSDI